MVNAAAKLDPAANRLSQIQIGGGGGRPRCCCDRPGGEAYRLPQTPRPISQKEIGGGATQSSARIRRFYFSERRSGGFFMSRLVRKEAIPDVLSLANEKPGGAHAVLSGLVEHHEV
jgi:hypothetical protein